MTGNNSTKGVKAKSTEQATQRVLALLVVIIKVHDPKKCVAWMKEHNLQQLLSPAEEVFVEQVSPSEHSRVAFSWRAEALVSLLWALKILPVMPPFDEQINVFDVEAIQAALKDPTSFASNVQLRDAQEISEMERYHYYQHWRVRDRDMGLNVGKYLEQQPEDPPIEELNTGIVFERRYSLSWLVGWGEDWDSVPTDT